MLKQKKYVLNSYNTSKYTAKISFINARYFDTISFICVKRRQTHNNNNEKKTQLLSSRSYVLSHEYQLRFIDSWNIKVNYRL